MQRDSEHRRTNSDPGHRRTSSGSTKRKSPSGEEKEWLKVVPSDEKEQKEALERMTKSPAGAASVPFRPDRRPVRREHKRGLSVGSLTLSRMYSRDTSRGMPYPRQTPPTSPRGDPYHHSSHSPYGYGHSPYPYHCPPTPTSPGMMRYSRSYSWDNEHHQPPPSPYHHHHHTHHHFHHNHSRPPPPPRSSSDPGSPDRHHPYGPPSPVSHGRKGGLLLLRDRQGKPLVDTITRRMKVGGRLVPMATPTVTAPVVHQCRRVRDTSTPIRRTSIHHLITSSTTMISITAHITTTLITVVLLDLDYLLLAHARAMWHVWTKCKTWW